MTTVLNVKNARGERIRCYLYDTDMEYIEGSQVDFDRKVLVYSIVDLTSISRYGNGYRLHIAPKSTCTLGDIINYEMPR